MESIKYFCKIFNGVLLFCENKLYNMVNLNFFSYIFESLTNIYNKLRLDNGTPKYV